MDVHGRYLYRTSSFSIVFMVVTKQQTESLEVVPPLILSLSAHTNPNCRNEINPNYDPYYLVMIPIVLPLSHTKSIPIADFV
jgi:hypothetical protein